MDSLEPILHYLARRFQNHRVPMEDLMQEGRIAAWRAESTFDPRRGKDIRKFCILAAQRAMQNYLVSPSCNRVERYTTMGEFDMESPMFAGRDFAPALIDALSPPDPKPEPPPQLNAQEAEVLKLACTGLQSVEVAERMCLARRTVDLYLGQAYKKLGAKNIVCAYNVAMSRGIIQPPPLERQKTDG